MSRIDTTSFAHNLLGGLSLGNARLQNQQQQALAEQALAERQRENDRQAAMAQAIFGERQAQNAYGQQQDAAQRQANIDLGASIFDGIPNPPQLNGYENPSAMMAVAGQQRGRLQDQTDATGYRDYLATEQGQGPGAMGPPTAGVAGLEQQPLSLLKMQVQESARSRYQREKEDRERESLIAGLHDIQARIRSDPGSASRYEKTVQYLENRLAGLDNSAAAREAGIGAMVKAGPDVQGLADAIQAERGVSPEDAYTQAKHSLSLNSLDSNIQRQILNQADPQVLSALKTHVSNAEKRVKLASTAVNVKAAKYLTPTTDETNELAQAKAEYNAAAKAYMAYAPKPPQAAPQQQAPAGPPAMPGVNATEAMDAAISANPQQAGEPDDVYIKRITGLLRGGQQ